MINFNGKTYNLVYGYKKTNKRWFALQDIATNKIYILNLDIISFISGLAIYELLNYATLYKKSNKKEE